MSVRGNVTLPANPVGRDALRMSGSGDWHTVDIVSTEGIINTVQVRIFALGFTTLFRPSLVSQFPGEGSSADVFNSIFGGRDFGSCPNITRGDTYLNAITVIALSQGAQAECRRVNLREVQIYYMMPPTAAIQILSPNPLSMQSGTYTGYLNLLLGSGGDIDMSNVTDGPFVIRLHLTVEHDFGVRFPAGSRLLSLVPEGGWMAWLQRGRKPTRLFRDQNFDLQTSAPFKMRLICEFPAGASCGIQSDRGDRVPLEVSVSLTGGFQDAASQPVTRYPLTSVASPSFRPSGYQLSKGTMHFEVPKVDMETMLTHPGTRYSGNVTIIFEPDF